MRTKIYVAVLAFSLSLMASKSAFSAGLFADSCNQSEPQLVLFIDQVAPGTFKFVYITKGGAVRMSNTKEIRELKDGYGEFRLENNDVAHLRPDPTGKFVEFYYLNLNGNVIIDKGNLGGKKAVLEKCPESSGAPGSPAEAYAQVAIKNWGAVAQQDALMDLYKSRCTQYLNAQQRCATAGDIDRCMDIIAPGYKSYGIDPALCGFVLQR